MRKIERTVALRRDFKREEGDFAWVRAAKYSAKRYPIPFGPAHSFPMLK